MPNYTTTTIKVPEKYWDKLKELLDVKKDENGDYSADFERLAPIHPDLLKTTSGSGSYRTDDIRGFFEEQLKFQNEIANPIFEELYNNTITRSEFVEASVKALYKDKEITDLVTKILGCLENVQTFIEGYFNLQRYGFVDWYEARNTLWGTKWNACSVFVSEDSHVVTFQTAWSTPVGILKKLSKFMPLTVSYADEDMGGATGIYLLKKGVGFSGAEDQLARILQNNKRDTEDENTVFQYLANQVINGYDYSCTFECFDEEDLKDMFPTLDSEKLNKVIEEFGDTVEPRILEYL